MQLLSKYFPELSSEQILQFKIMHELYIDWNIKVNVISRKDIVNLTLHHFLHSLAIAKIIQFPEKSTVIDIGTGGGFPGIPLAVLFPNVQFTLMDSIGKKINVVKDIAEKLKLKNVVAIKARSNEYKAEKFDFIISRAVSSLQKFHLETQHLIKTPSEFPESGIYYLKGGDFFAELNNFERHKTFAISEYFVEEYFQNKHVVFIEL